MKYTLHAMAGIFIWPQASRLYMPRNESLPSTMCMNQILYWDTKVPFLKSPEHVEQLIGRLSSLLLCESLALCYYINVVATD
jgi:hypothetical protein